MPALGDQSRSSSWHCRGVGERVAGCLFRSGSTESEGRGQAGKEPSSPAPSIRPSVAGSFAILCGHLH